MKKGFTLIELLIVIGILAILAVAVVLVLNPAEMLKQARDSQRISDLSSVKSAVAMYLTTASGASLSVAVNCTVACPAGVNYPFAAGTGTTNATTTVTGGGWVPINFTSITGGSPLGALPIDPVNAACTPGSGTATNCFYAYRSDGTGFKLTGVLESAKYNGMMATDGGSNNNFYEVGTSLAL